MVVLLALTSVPGSLRAADVAGPSVTVAADATDNVAVIGVRFLLDGVQIGAEDRTSPWSIVWDSTTVANGTYTLTAIARDAAGNEGTSSPVAMTVNNVEGDTTPPSVATTSPGSGSVVSATVSVSASATDNVGVVGVQFLLDGAPLGPEDTTAPYAISWNTTLVANGTHTLAARARDAAGNLATSSSVSVTVDNGTGSGGDTTPPSVLTTGPAGGSTVSATISVTASASDNVGVVGVQFLLDGQPLGAEDTTSPYAISWNTNTAADGPHVLSARARDAAGNQSVSPGVSTIVDNSPGGDPPPETGSSGSGMVDLTVERSTPGFRRIRAQADAGDELQLYIDAALVTTVSGDTLDYEWDVRPLLGSHEVRVLANEASELVASSSLFYSVESASAPSVTLDVIELPLIGATVIQARANVGVASPLELYIDGELKVSKLGTEIEYAWDPGSAAHQILFVAYDALGVVASVGVVYVP